MGRSPDRPRRTGRRWITHLTILPEEINQKLTNTLAYLATVTAMKKCLITLGANVNVLDTALGPVSTATNVGYMSVWVPRGRCQCLTRTDQPGPFKDKYV